MAGKIRLALAVLSLALTAAFALPVGGQTNTAVRKQSGTVILPATAPELKAKSYDVVIDPGGSNIKARIEVGGASQSSASTGSGGKTTSANPGSTGATTDNSAGGTDSSSGSLWLFLLPSALLPALFIGLGLWYYFKRVVPRRQMQPYEDALALLRAEKYQEALPLLTQVESRLLDQQRRDARFFIAFAYYKENNASEAERWLDALHRENPGDASTAYLLAQIRVEQERYDEAEPVLEKMDKNKQLKTHHARKLLGLVKYRRAIVALRAKRVDAAAQLFEKVQELGDYADQIPADLRNRHIALGTQALFEKETTAARQQFESLQTSVAGAPAEQRDHLLATAKLGLALVAWMENNADSNARVESLCVEAALLFDPKGALEMGWPSEETQKDIVEQLAALEQEKELRADEAELNRCLRDIHFLRGMAILRGWSKMDGHAAHDSLEEQFQSALGRLACAHARDEQFSDALLVVGLLMYYFYKPGPQRTLAVNLLEQARKLGMHDPDALEIVNNRQRIERANASAVDKYLQVLDNYLNDDTVRREVRVSLIERLSKFRRIQNWEKRPTLSPARNVEPTLAEVRHRSEVLLVRVGQILSSRTGESADAGKLRDLSQNIMQESERLMEQASAIEKQESELLVLTGAQLLNEQ